MEPGFVDLSGSVGSWQLFGALCIAVLEEEQSLIRAISTEVWRENVNGDNQLKR